VYVCVCVCRFKHARKVVLDEPPESMEVLREILSKEIHVSCCGVFYFLSD